MEILTSMAESVAELLKERGDTVAVSESAAGGLIAAVLLSVPGASRSEERRVGKECRSRWSPYQ